MSRIGKLSIKIPSKVEVKIDNQFINISGPHGQLSRRISDLILVNADNNEITVTPKNNSREARALHGLSRTLINNMVIGFQINLNVDLKLKG